ncbi:acyl carrier protein [Streptomyces lavendulae]|uniref:acyl carrier protein n=1 Tax=Streptomyces lavendulae TaxID=1914 RepID=UPI0031F09025
MTTEDFGEDIESIRRWVADKLIEIISELLRRDVRDVNPKTGLECELELDSIHRVELSTRISRICGISAEVEEMDDAETFGQLTEIIAQAVSTASKKRDGIRNA